MSDYVEIPLSGKRGKGLFAAVDIADAELVRGRKWYPVFQQTDVIYAVSRNKDRSVQLMHRLILGVTRKDLPVDHINHNGLDNRRRNLRLVTVSENNLNRRPMGLHRSAPRVRLPDPYKTPYRGVEKFGFRYDCRLTLQEKCLGSFSTAEEAAMRYNVAARRKFGKSAILNQVDMG